MNGRTLCPKLRGSRGVTFASPPQGITTCSLQRPLYRVQGPAVRERQCLFFAARFAFHPTSQRLLCRAPHRFVPPCIPLPAAHPALRCVSWRVLHAADVLRRASRLRDVANCFKGVAKLGYLISRFVPGFSSSSTKSGRVPNVRHLGYFENQRRRSATFEMCPYASFALGEPLSQFLQQRLGVLQIFGVETFGKPAVDIGE